MSLPSRLVARAILKVLMEDVDVALTHEITTATQTHSHHQYSQTTITCTI